MVTADLALVRRLATADHGLAVVATTRPDGTVHTSVVNAGVFDAASGPAVAFVARGNAKKLDHFRRSGRAAVVFRNGWEWVSVEGPVHIVDSAEAGQELPALLRTIFRAAGGTHENWAEFDRVMAAEGRVGVLASRSASPATADVSPATPGMARAGTRRWGMPSAEETEAAELAQIEADLAELTGHVDRWITDRFLTAEDATGMNLVDVSGLILWLQQWHIRFGEYDETAAELSEKGRPAVADRLAQIRIEIDNSIESFTQIAAGLPDLPT